MGVYTQNELLDLMLKDVKPTWYTIIRNILTSNKCSALLTKLCSQDSFESIYPPISLIFNAFKFCDLNQIKVVIIGQDPYHGEGQAMGLSFSVSKSAKRVPPTIYRILKEAKVTSKKSTDLTTWAQQGVLLLNTVLTVEKSKPCSHSNWGWTYVTDQIVRILSDKSENPIVFLLWGLKAQSKKKLLNCNKHKIIETSHPSPLATKGNFLNSKCFERANEFLIDSGITPIDWQSINI